MNVGYLLTNSANKFPDRPAIISEEGRSTFKIFNQRTDRLAGAMLRICKTITQLFLCRRFDRVVPVSPMKITGIEV